MLLIYVGQMVFRWEMFLLVYTFEEIKTKVKAVAEQYDIEEVRLFGSYYDGQATNQSDLDFIVTYGPGCRGLNRVGFMMALEKGLEKDVDVINIKFKPEFMKDMDLDDDRRIVYEKQKYNES